MSRKPPSASIAVIGSGPGGAVTATVLAEAGLSVLLIEDGAYLPLDSAPHFSRDEILQKYRNAGVSVTMGSAKVAWVEGRCVGGGSEVNRGVYHRTPEAVLAAWAREFEVDTLGVADLAPHFEACERVARVSHAPGDPTRISQKLRDGARALGWSSGEVPCLFDFREDRNGTLVGHKQSMTTTFIPRFLAAGGQLLSDTRVTRLERSGARWRLIAEQRAPEQHRRRPIEIDVETVFVAAGAVQTPLLLRRSGIRRNIGNSLAFHPMTKVVALFPDVVNELGQGEPYHQVKEFDPRFSMGCSVSKRPALALALVDRPIQRAMVERHWPHMAIYYAQSTGGRARVRGVPGFRDPLVIARDNRADMRDLAEGLRRLAECLFAAGAAAVFPGIPSLPVLESAADLAKLPPELPPSTAGVTTMHLFSSCPMGEDRSRCAVDSFGKVHGIEGLHIADASLLCGPTVVNPQGSVMGVAHRNAQHFLEGRTRQSRVVLPAGRRARE
jgi:choline dehydrogenase-like flavoprotein